MLPQWLPKHQAEVYIPHGRRMGRINLISFGRCAKNIRKPTFFVVSTHFPEVERASFSGPRFPHGPVPREPPHNLGHGRPFDQQDDGPETDPTTAGAVDSRWWCPLMNRFRLSKRCPKYSNNLGPKEETLRNHVVPISFWVMMIVIQPFNPYGILKDCSLKWSPQFHVSHVFCLSSPVLLHDQNAILEFLPFFAASHHGSSWAKVRHLLLEDFSEKPNSIRFNLPCKKHRRVGSRCARPPGSPSPPRTELKDPVQNGSGADPFRPTTATAHEESQVPRFSSVFAKSFPPPHHGTCLCSFSQRTWQGLAQARQGKE